MSSEKLWNRNRYPSRRSGQSGVLPFDADSTPVADTLRVGSIDRTDTRRGTKLAGLAMSLERRLVCALGATVSPILSTLMPRLRASCYKSFSEPCRVQIALRSRCLIGGDGRVRLPLRRAGAVHGAGLSRFTPKTGRLPVSTAVGSEAPARAPDT